MSRERIERVPTGGGRFNPPTSAVGVDVGTTAAEGVRQAEEGQRLLDEAMRSGERPVHRGGTEGQGGL